MPYELSLCFFYCVDAYWPHHGAIIATSSKNNVAFIVVDKCSSSIALFRTKCYQFYTCFRIIVCTSVSCTVLA